MKSFKSYLTEEQLNEVLITFGNRPNYEQVILLAGGAGSGKGFVKDKIIGIEAKTFDVDQIKGLIVHPGTPKLNKKVKELYGIDVTKLNLRNPKDVALLHKINDEMGISKKVQDQFFKNVPKNPEKLPNVIFDTTMKSEKKITELVDTVLQAGYKRENIHVVWIMNDVNTALKQNKARERVVPEDILIDTHKGVSETMAELMKNGRFQEFIDGEVWVVFNKIFVDSTLEFAQRSLQDSDLSNWAKAKGWSQKDIIGLKKQDSKGSYVKDAVLVKIKDRKKKSIPFTEIGTKFLQKIKEYVPKETQKLWESLT